MEEKQFREQLAGLTALARKQGLCVSMEQIRDFFGELCANEQQLGFLLEYLKNQKIAVGEKEEVEEFLSLEDKNYLQDYLAGLKELAAIGQEEMTEIMYSAIAGDLRAQHIVMEQSLPKVVELARLYTGQGALIEDLIGEGNLALAQGVSQLGCLDAEGDVAQEIDGFLGKLMMDAMEELINEELQQKDIDEKELEKVNHVSDVARELSEELRRKVSPEEVCANSELTLEDVQEAMRISANLIDSIEMEYRPDEADR